jgi:aspartyl-tRNA synthetase
VKMRTHTCGELRKSDVGRNVRLCGWVQTVRDHGGVIFIDLRDRYGITQVIFDPTDSPDAKEMAESTRGEFVLQVEGEVESRPEDMVNAKLPTGEIEVRSQNIAILNRSEVPPFPLEDDKASRVSEDLRFEYRYLDLRRRKMQQNLRLRHDVTQAVRNYLDGVDFLEVETPILSKSTPEGARDYLVPSRMVPGTFYALPQAPQQYKQLLMIAGVDRYFQIARCFRDEDLRSDRQPEFTQIDIEMSYITPEDLFEVVDGMMVAILEASGHPVPSLPLPRMSYEDAMSRFGSDKPDLRFGMELVLLNDVFAETSFKVFSGVLGKGGSVKAVNAKSLGGVSAGVMDNWTGMAQGAGLGGLAFIRVQEDGSWKSPIVKFFSDAEQEGLRSALAIEPGDLILFGAGPVEQVNNALGRLRLIAGETAGVIPDDVFEFTWVTEFPLFERTGDGHLTPMHHPFTSPQPDDMPLLDSDPGNVRAQAYDLVLNGVEIGGGSIRIHNDAVQQRMFELLRIPEEEIQSRFGHLIRALTYGAPPHGGIAFGMDRVVMLMAGEESIREVIAFPKTQKAVDLMMNAPSQVDDLQLRDLHIALALPDPLADS